MTAAISQPSSGGTAGITNVYSFPQAVSNYVSSALAFATQGNQFTPIANMTIDQVTASWYGGGVNGHHYLCSVVVINASRVIQSVVGSTTVVGTAANQDLKFVFTTPLTISSGTLYAILITDTDAALTTTSVAVGGIGAASGVFPLYPGIPVSGSANDQRVSLAKNTAPASTDTLTASGGVAAVGIRAQF